MDGESLSNLLKNTLLTLGLKIENIRGQCYDGAASMRGSYSGVAKRIKDENKLALYVHCYAHVLNLCVVDVSGKVVPIRNMFGILNKIYTFIGASSKRHSIFERIQKESNLSNNTLKSLSDTRRGCRIEAIRSVINNFNSIVLTLENINETDSTHGPDANSISNNIQNFEFIFSATIVELQSLRSDDSFDKIWTETEQLASKESISPPTIPRIRTIPSRLGGGETLISRNVASYFKTNIYFPVLDIVIHDIETKFAENNLKILIALQNCLSTRNHRDEDILEVCNTYNINFDDLKAELKLFGKMCSSTNIDEHFEAHLTLYLEKDLIGSFDNIYLLYKIFLSIPMSSASSERSFSSLRRLKTFTRNTIGQERLSSLAILHIEKTFEINFDTIIDQFDADSTERGRRLQLS
ncbi:unnamed protein product [Macrosiphum euphorbiae]|uniref:HAT C-terminal dimerisation domain-containing protein n=1 Tax=Macrosiphum euphorbiae TaxID=13131 RepID=A0AAV0WDM1_9HEMI|nr:unnamed protein product [Macrosiphum euphorbiae]